MNQLLENPLSEAYLKSSVQLPKELQVRLDTGLPGSSVAKRRQKYGPNVLPRSQQQTAFMLLLERFRDPLVIVLLLAGIISLMLGEVADAIIVSLAIMVDVALSFIQVWRTEKTLEKVRQSVQQMATVKRDAVLKRIPSSELVLGDIIELQAGERIPADARLLSSNGLLVQEASLTGESDDVAKQPTRLKVRTPLANRTNMVYMGTSIVSGSGIAIVTATGIYSEYGKIAQILSAEPSPVTPLRQKLQRSSFFIGWIIIGSIVVLSVISFLQGKDLNETIRTAITLIVSAIPEDLTMILTIALTVGVARILRHGGVVRQLASGETLGAATVVCTDKTGTLTKGVMTATGLDFLQGTIINEKNPPGDSFHTLALIGLALVPDAHRVAPDIKEYVGSATERTALAFTEQFGFNQLSLRREWKQRAAIQFSSQWKYRASIHDHPTQPIRTLFVLGAPDILLARSSECLNQADHVEELTEERRQEIHQKIIHYSQQGIRLLAIAVKRGLTSTTLTHKDVNDLLFLGVLIINDPIRPEVSDVIRQTEHAGVQVKIVTGDHEATAQAVARDLGMTVPADSICSGFDLERMTDEEVHERIDHVVIFSRVTPLDKQRIVRILQARGQVVAMTGDGVNDAVALKAADIGVAMGSGKDIAQDAADLILLDDNFVTIVWAIREGRVVRDNIKKVIAFLLSTNAAEVGLFFVSIITGLPFPLLPSQILWINLVTDGTSDLALSLEPEESNVMRRPPENPASPLLSAELLLHIGFAGVVTTIAALILYGYATSHLGVGIEYTRTLIFTFVSVASLLSVWSWRSLSQLIWKRGLWQNRWIPLSAILSLGLQLLAIYFPPLQNLFSTVALNLKDWVFIIILGLITVLIIDIRKLVWPIKDAIAHYKKV